MKKLFAVLLIVCLLLTSVSALAASKKSKSKSEPTPPPQGQSQEGQPERLDLQGMVKKGVISQETMDKIKAYMESNRPEGATEGEAAAQPEEPEEPEEGEEPEDGEEPEEPEGEEGAEQTQVPGVLGELLKAGIITQEECDAMAAYTPENTKK